MGLYPQTRTHPCGTRRTGTGRLQDTTQARTKLWRQDKQKDTPSQDTTQRKPHLHADTATVPQETNEDYYTNALLVLRTDPIELEFLTSRDRSYLTECIC